MNRLASTMTIDPSPDRARTVAGASCSPRRRREILEHQERSCSKKSARPTGLYRRSNCSRASESRSVSPAMYGMTQQSNASAVPLSSNGSMCGCCNRAVVLISARDRSARNAAPKSGCNTLIATSGSCVMSCARYTAAIRPAPSSRSMRWRSASAAVRRSATSALTNDHQHG